MTPPPTMTPRARVGRSIAMNLNPHPRIVGIEGGRGQHGRVPALTLEQNVEAAAGGLECRLDAGKGQAFLDAVAVRARGGDADAAAVGCEHRLAAARIGI